MDIESDFDGSQDKGDDSNLQTNKSHRGLRDKLKKKRKREKDFAKEKKIKAIEEAFMMIEDSIRIIETIKKQEISRVGRDARKISEINLKTREEYKNIYKKKQAIENLRNLYQFDEKIIDQIRNIIQQNEVISRVNEIISKIHANPYSIILPWMTQPLML